MSIRKPFAALCASLLAATLLSLGLSWSAWHIVGQPDYIKKTLSQSGIYNTIVQDVLKQKESDLADGTGLPTDQPQVQGIISKALSPELLQGQTEKMVDGSFDFIQGKSSTLNTSFDISGAKQQIADGIAAYTTQHLQSLPTCTAATMPTAAVDPLEATCLPPGFDVTAASNQARDNILNSGAFKDTNLNANEIQTGNGTSLQDQLHAAPQAYKWVEWSIYGQGVLALLLVAGLVLLSTDWRIGIRRVGVIALWTGAVNAILAWLSSFGMHALTRKLTQTAFGGQPVQQKLLDIAQIVIDDIRTWWLWYGIALAAAGVILLVVYRFIKSTPAKVATALAKEEGVSIDETSVKAAPDSALDTPPTNPMPPKRPRKIQ